MAKKNTTKKKKLNLPLLIFTIIDLVLVTILMLNIARLGVLPLKYEFILLFILFLLFTIIILFQKLKKKVFKVLSYIIFTLIFVVSIVGIYYTGVTLKFLKESFNQVNSSYESKYLVLTKNDYKDEYDLIGKRIGYYANIPYIDKAIAKLSSSIEYETVSYKSVLDLFNKYDKELDAIMIQEDFYKGIKESMTTISYDDYKVIYSFDITIDEKVDTNELKDVINIYIGGFDFTDKNNDFNMLVTLNRKTKKVLLTSIPRDYYLYVPELEMSEALDYTMVWGVNLPMSALEKLFDIKIDYYVKIDTSSLVGIVDALGGVNFCSDTSYVTTHSLVNDTYDDSKVKHLQVTKGCKEYSGIEILTIARERLAFPDGDRQRQKNCQQIIINIVDKMTSFDSVTKYTELLDKLSDLYTTNMPSKLLTSVVKDAIDGDKWKIDTQSVDGTKGSGLIHLGTSRAWSLLIPDEDSVSKAKDNMKKISE